MSRVPVERAIDKLIQQGIELVQHGDLVAAREILSQVVVLDPQNEKAWLWRSGAVETDAERKLCLEHVLRINPDNEIARQGVTHLVHPSAPTPPPAGDESAINGAERRIKRLSIQPPPPEPEPAPAPLSAPDAPSSPEDPLPAKKTYSSEMLYWPEVERRRRPLWIAVVLVIIVIVIGAYTLLHSLHIIDALLLPVTHAAALALVCLMPDY